LHSVPRRQLDQTAAPYSRSPATARAAFLVNEHLATPWHAVAEGPNVNGGLVELDATRLGATRKAHPHEGSLAEVDHILRDAAAGGEVGAGAAVDPAAVDEQRLVAVVERRPLDRLVREIELGNALGAVLLRFGAVFRGILSGRCRARTSSLRRV
jgi:hypothetical protein